MYKVEIKASAAKELDDLPHHILERAFDQIRLLESNPRPHGSKKLQGTQDRWRIRIGDYRILYRIDDASKTVFVYRALHRKNVYQ